VPDLDVFCGRGGKDIVPLYRDAQGTPNADPALLASVGAKLDRSSAVAVEDLYAYAYGLMAGTDYSARFADELQTPGPRVPLTADPELFAEATAFGKELLWLHTYGERFASGRASFVVSALTLDGELSLPERPSDIRYDAENESLKVGRGAVIGVRPAVWGFEVSGMQVVKKWLGYRTARGAGRVASSTSPLDHIRPTEWPREWTAELLEMLSVLHRTIDFLPRGIDLLDRIVAGPLVLAGDLPAPQPDLRQPPTGGRGPAQATLDI
jgi:hypothetical protein